MSVCVSCLKFHVVIKITKLYYLFLLFKLPAVNSFILTCRFSHCQFATYCFSLPIQVQFIMNNNVLSFYVLGLSIDKLITDAVLLYLSETDTLLYFDENKLIYFFTFCRHCYSKSKNSSKKSSNVRSKVYENASIFWKKSFVPLPMMGLQSLTYFQRSLYTLATCR